MLPAGMNRETGMVGALLVFRFGEITNLKELREISCWFLMVPGGRFIPGHEFHGLFHLHLSFRGKERDEAGYSSGDFGCGRFLYRSY
jgi:hypothetical protein